MINCPCEEFDNDINLIKCNSCNYLHHIDCVQSFAKKMINYECCKCQLKNMDPFISQEEIIMDPKIIKYDYKKHCFTLSKKFVISETIKDRISKYKEEFNDKSSPNPLFIIIRCLRVDEEGYEHHWPWNGNIRINDKKIIKDFCIPKNPPRSKLRLDFPIVFYFLERDKTDNVINFNPDHMFNFNTLKPNEENSIFLFNNYSINDNDSYHYVLSIELIKVRTLEEIKLRIPKIDSIKKLQELRRVNDASICKEKVNFKDILIENRIKIPVRSLNCFHSNVFDLENFLLQSLKNKRYDCLICKKKAVRLYVDCAIVNLMENNPDLDSAIIDTSYQISINDLSEIKTINENISFKTAKISEDDTELTPLIKEIPNLKKLACNLNTNLIDINKKKSEVISLLDDEISDGQMKKKELEKKKVNNINCNSTINLDVGQTGDINKKDTNTNESNKNDKSVINKNKVFSVVNSDLNTERKQSENTINQVFNSKKIGGKKRFNFEVINNKRLSIIENNQLRLDDLNFKILMNQIRLDK